MAAKSYKVQVHLVAGTSFVHPEGDEMLSKSQALSYAGHTLKADHVDKCEILQSVQVVNK